MTQDRNRARARCQIGDHRYELELALLAWRPVDTLREQTDQGQEPGEGSLSNRALWRRTGRDFREGAGQAFFDEDETSSRRRFFESKGIDCWDPRALSLLPDTALMGSASAASTMQLVAAGGVLYFLDGTVLRYSTNGTSWAGTVNMSGQTPIYIAPGNGTRLWVSIGTAIWYVDAGDPTGYNYTGQQSDVVAWVNNRLVFANDNYIHESTSGGASSLEIWTHTNSAWRFTQLLPTPDALYMGGNLGGQGYIYRVSVAETGTWSGVTLAGGLEVGEEFRAMEFYAGVMLVATNLGVRLLIVNDDGSLTRSKFIEEGGEAHAVHAHGKYAWSSWSNYDGLSSGLMRLDLSLFTDTLVPAFASDLMATAQGNVVSIATFNEKRYFAVAGAGAYRELTTLVDEGTYDSGWVTFGVSELKSYAQAEVRLAAALGAGDVVRCYVEEENGTLTQVLSVDEGQLGETGSIDGVDGEAVKVLLTLDRTTAAGPTVRRWTLRAIPLAFAAEEWFLPVRLSTVVDARGQDVPLNTLEEYRYLAGLRDDKTRVRPKLGDHELARGYIAALAADPGYVKKWVERDGKVFLEMICVVQFTTIG